MMRKSKLKLGEILVREGVITEEELNKALQAQAHDGGPIGEVLIKLGLAEERDVVMALSKQLGIPHASYAKGLLKPVAEQDLITLIPEAFAREHLVLPISRNLNSLTVAFADPLDLITADNIRRMSGCLINPIIATKTDLRRAIDEFYGQRNMLQEAITDSYAATDLVAEERLAGAPSGAEEDLSLDELIAKAEEAPVIKLVDLIIRQAIQERASDIHIEPFKERINIRYRTDGVLYEIPPPAKHLLPAIASRIKILANLDIAERRLPQDGAFIVRLEGKIIDLRVSTVPTIYGEKVVLRILDKTRVPLDLAQLGFNPRELEHFEKAIRSPHGLVFLTGPTGSGKTTTLYAALNTIKSPHKNILTIEDPVEFRLDDVNQVQVRPNIGLTFANGLRAFLRQDPDIIMVGEVRDLETAQICIRAALTGHLVFSTLHTNDALGAVWRLIDLGIERYFLVSALRLVAAQRLVRRLCGECKEAYEPSQELIEQFHLGSEPLYRARGCAECNNTGYKGRVGIFEVVPITERIQRLVAESATSAELNRAAREAGFPSLLESGMRKVQEGVTSIEEVLGVAIAAPE